MYIQQLYTGCLSEAAYYIESNGEAAIVDPLRDIEAYLLLAKERGTTIKYIFETHFHADFVSGHLDLASSTGATIIYGPETETSYKVKVAADNEIFKLGNISIKVLHTPGHTLESSCFLVLDENGREHALFTGDTLFIGDVGRPDLSSGNLDSNTLAVMLYHSLNNKIKTLPDDVIVYPAHGAGSACGKNLSTETTSTIGQQKATNYALQQNSPEAFVAAVTTGLNTAPSYFAVNAEINKKGYKPLNEIIESANNPIAIESVKYLIKHKINDTLIVDTRHSDLFAEGFIPTSISIGLNGRFAEWAGELLEFDKDIVLVTDSDKLEESTVRLARVGFERIIGHVDGGYDAWQSAGEHIDMIINIEPDELAMDLPHDDKLLVVDVRNNTEFEEKHVVGAFHAPLNGLNKVENIAMLPDEANLYVHCAGGYRSIIAASLIKKQGIHNVRNIVGGFKRISEEEGIPLETSKKAAIAD